MNPLRTLCLVACLLAAVCASPNQNQQQRSNSGSLKPSDWVSHSELNALPAVDQINWQSLENMSVEKGAEMLQKLYHLSKINNDLSASFVPSPSNIPAVIMKPNGQNVSVNLNQLVAAAKQQSNFGKQEVTIIITGLPENKSRSVKKANCKLLKAFEQRYNGQRQYQSLPEQWKLNNDNNERSSSEENSKELSQASKSAKPSGTLVLIDLGSTITSFERYAKLDTEATGNMIGDVIVELIQETAVPQETVNIVAQGVAAHVAGAAGRQYSRTTGNKLRRITALDPANIFFAPANTLVALARGDADFVDAIHTSVYGMGTEMRVGDIDFFPNGPSTSVPGADNVIEASMRATRYYAETVRPGSERNFPAVAASSLKQYKNNNGHGKRVYMGIATDFDLEGDYILQVNAKSPFGKSAPAQKQISYHGSHSNSENNDE